MVVIVTLLSQVVNAQVAIRENSIVERAVFKPQQFDSLTNIIMQERPIDYKKYVGYKLFFLPKSKNYTPQYSSDKKEKIIDFLFLKDTVQIVKEGKIPFEQVDIYKIWGNEKNMKGARLEQYRTLKKKYENIDKEKTNIYQPKFYYERTNRTDGEIYGKIGTIPDSVEGKYFTIIDIKGKEPYGSKEYKKLEDVELEKERDWQLGLKISLRNELNNDTLYWIVDQARYIERPFLLVPYFEKQRNLYLNQNLVLKDKTRTNLELENLIDINTGAIVSIKYGEVWTCTDISFIDSKDTYYLSGFYFLKNGDKEVKIELESNLLDKYFMLETEYRKQELEKQKKEEEKVHEEQEREKIRQQEQIKFRNDCIIKWGQKLGTYVADGKVVLGMNKEMCIAAWGNPININRTIVKGLTHEQWVYGWANYLYFDNGILTGIQD